jgi:hypothetical protein
MLRAAIMGVALVSFVGLSAPASATYEEDLKAKGAKRLNTADIKALLTGNTYKGMTPRRGGTDFWVYYKSDGKADVRIITSSGRERQDDGVWEAVDDKSCRQWSRFGGGKRGCRCVYKTGPNSIETTLEDGGLSSKGVILKGNSENF